MGRQDGARVVPGRCHSCSKIMSQWYRSGARLVPQWYRSGARLVPQRCYSNARPMADLVESPRVDEAVVGQPDHIAVVPGHQISSVLVWQYDSIYNNDQ